MAVSETRTARYRRGRRAGAQGRRDYLVRRHYFRWPEALPWLIAIGCFFVFPERMTFGSQVLVMVLFALSLDLILGYAASSRWDTPPSSASAPIPSALGSLRLGWTEPISGIIAGGLVAALVGAWSGWFILRYRGLTLLMLTIAFAAMLQESGNLAPTSPAAMTAFRD